jgi:diguanylate cyclase (GGDEF)-like protein
LCIALFIGIYVLFRCQSPKRHFFLLFQIAIIVLLYGFILECFSAGAGGGGIYASFKMMRLGAAFMVLFVLFFTADFCDIKLHPGFIKAPLALFACFLLLAAWKAQPDSFAYSGFGVNPELNAYPPFKPGLEYFVVGGFSGVCIIAALVMAVLTMKKRQGKYRAQLVIVCVFLLIPLIAESIYLALSIVSPNHLFMYFTPLVTAFMNLVLFLGVMRYDIFDIIPMATITAMDYIKEGFILVDAENNYLSSNEAAAEIFPGILTLSRGDPIHSLKDWPQELALIATGWADFSISKESPRYFRTSVSPIMSGGVVRARIILMREITDTLLLMNELKDAAYTDYLTGLYNRKHFYEIAGMMSERSRRLGKSLYTAMIDIDLFKNVNDEYGHAAGDQALKIVAGIIRSTIRSYDLVGRYGGEEFVILLTDVDLSGARQLLERIRKNIAKAVIKSYMDEIKITCSIGFALFTEFDSLDEAIHKADNAMYQAKNAGRNQVKMYAPDLEPAASLPGSTAG